MNLLTKRFDYHHLYMFFFLAKSMLGGVDEHIAFLLMRALELQGEVEEAFGFAVVYRALDPQVKAFML